MTGEGGAVGRDAVICVERAKGAQESLRLGNVCFAWVIEERQRTRVGGAPCGEFKDQTGDVGREDFGQGKGAMPPSSPLVQSL